MVGQLTVSELACRSSGFETGFSWSMVCSRLFSISLGQARSQDLEKGGYFERVKKVQTTLTRILIVLESVSPVVVIDLGGPRARRQKMGPP